MCQGILTISKDSEYSDVNSFEDYKQQIMESFEDENADHDKAAKTAFEYVLKKTEEEDIEFFRNDDGKNVVIYYYVEGDIMSINAYGYSGNDQADISYSDLSGLKKSDVLEKLIIYNCVTPEFNAKDIEGMTGLKYLDFNCSEIENYESLKTLTGLEDLKMYFCDLSSSKLKEKKKALPDCVITLDDGSTVS